MAKLDIDYKLELIDKMMHYLGIDSYVVPHFNLTMPDIALGRNYRSQKLFRYHRYTRAMTYHGWEPDLASEACMRAKVLELHGIDPPEQFIDRIVNHLSDDCEKRARDRAKGKSIPNMERLILQFSGLGILNTY